MVMTGDDIAKKLGYDSTNAAEYAEHVQSVKREFLRRDHQDLLEGPKAIRDKTGSNLIWELGLDDFYKKYDEMWSLDRFGNNASARRTYANNFLLAQAKKARQDDAEERKKAEAAAKKKAERERQNTASSMKTRGRKRFRMEPPLSRNVSSPSGQKSSSPHRHSPHSSQYSPPPSPKRRKMIEKPDLKFPEFAIILKGLPNPPATSYDSTWKFEDLLNWILQKLSSLRGQRIVCWTEVTIRDEEYSDMLGCALNEKCNRMITDQSSWNAAVMAAQANRLKEDHFYGIAIFALLEIDTTTPEHSEEDVISPQIEVPEGRPLDLGISGTVGDVGGKKDDGPDLKGGTASQEDDREANGGEGTSPASKKSVICLY